MNEEMKSEILELMEYIIGRSDVRKGMKNKKLVSNNSDIDEELKNIKSDSVRKILLEVKKKNDDERIKQLTKTYGGIILKEGLFRKIMGYKKVVKKDK